MQTLIKNLLKQKTLTPDIISGLKRQWAKKSKLFPRNSLILKEYKKLLAGEKINPSLKKRKYFEKALRLKKIRSLYSFILLRICLTIVRNHLGLKNYN